MLTQLTEEGKPLAMMGVRGAKAPPIAPKCPKCTLFSNMTPLKNWTGIKFDQNCSKYIIFNHIFLIFPVNGFRMCGMYNAKKFAFSQRAPPPQIQTWLQAWKYVNMLFSAI